MALFKYFKGAERPRETLPRLTTGDIKKASESIAKESDVKDCVYFLRISLTQSSSSSITGIQSSLYTWKPRTQLSNVYTIIAACAKINAQKLMAELIM